MQEIENSGEREKAGVEAAPDAADQKRSEEYLLRLKYLQADFENYRKRAEKELAEVEEASARRVAVRLLGVLDELELAMKHAKSAEGAEIEEGVRMVYKNLGGVLESLGLERIECVGKPFDPVYHEAVEKVEGTGQEYVVAEEVRSGFTFKGHVIRSSMVKVELGKPRAAREENRDE